MQQLYGLEGFLHRMSLSPYRTQLVLKGGLLLAAMDSRRPTRDVDLAARAVPNDMAMLRQVVTDIVSVEVDDGITFDQSSVRATSIRETDEYGGVRVAVTGQLSSAHLRLGVDINIGDPIVPRPGWIAVPRLLGGELHVLGYPVEMVLAEKLVTAVQRGTANTRWRDFLDVSRLIGTRQVDGAAMTAALRRVAKHRDVGLAPLAEVLDGYTATAQTPWSRWRHKIGLDNESPDNFADLLEAGIAFADPVIGGAAEAATWDPVAGSWT